MIEERFEQIRTMKAEMSKNDELKRDKFMRDVIGLLKPLTKDKTAPTDGDHISQTADNDPRNLSERHVEGH